MRYVFPGVQSSGVGPVPSATQRTACLTAPGVVQGSKGHTDCILYVGRVQVGGGGCLFEE